MSEIASIFGGGAEHAHEQSRLEKILPAPAPIAGDGDAGQARVEGVEIPPIGLPGAAIAYEPFGPAAEDASDASTH